MTPEKIVYLTIAKFDVNFSSFSFSFCHTSVCLSHYISLMLNALISSKTETKTRPKKKNVDHVDAICDVSTINFFTNF